MDDLLVFLHQSRRANSNTTCATSSSGAGQGASQRITHVSMRYPTGSFEIQDIETFWNLYCRVVSKGGDCPPVGLLECMPTVIPVLVDADFKVDLQTRTTDTLYEPLFEQDVILRLVDCYQKVMQEVLTDSTDNFSPRDLCCFVLMKEPYVNEEKGCVKHGFHLHFPCVFLDKYTQEHELLPRVKRLWKSDHLPFLPSNPNIDSFLDTGYCKGKNNPWFLYKSSKNDEARPYLIVGMVDGNGEFYENWIPEFLRIDYQLFRNYNERIVLKTDNVEFYLPRILSTVVYGREVYHKQLNIDIAPLLPAPSQRNVVHLGHTRLLPRGGHARAQQDRADDQDIEKEIDSSMLYELLNALDIRRSIDRNDWIYIGWILYNIFSGSTKGLELWVMFSRRCKEKFQKEVCEDLWETMEVRDLSLGSLKCLVKKDNPEAYAAISKKYLRLHMDKALVLNGTHNDLAKALFKRYETEFVCGSIKDRTWFHFSTHIWERIEEGYLLRQKLSNEMADEYEKLIREVLHQMKIEGEARSSTSNPLDFCFQDTETGMPYQSFLRQRDIRHEDSTSQAEEEGEELQKKKEQKVKNIMTIISHLKSAPFKTNVMKEAAEVFYSAGFTQKLDSNPYLFAFENGVYDLKQMVFRQGKPNDYLSMQTSIKYRDDFHDQSPEVLQVQDFLAKVFPDNSVRDYFMDISSEIFIGRNLRKIFQVWTGNGDNGKSITQELFEKMLGPYSIKLPTALIVGKRTQSSSACPELARAGNGVRLAMLQEPDKKDVINIGILKELSGNDTFFARGLYSTGQEITPMFKLVLICNDPPKLPYSDAATWNRIRVIPFESKFDDDAPEDPDEQLLQKRFPRDRSFGEKIPAMLEAFAWVLLRHLVTKPPNRPEPQKVQVATANYKRKNDMFKQFLDDNIEKCEDGFLSLNVLYTEFKEWFKEAIGHNFSLPNKQEAKDEFIRHLGPIYAGGTQVRWAKYRLKALVQPTNEIN